MTFKIKKQYYDLVISIGQNCVTPEILKENSLRLFSSPLDWLLISSYHLVIDLIENKFDNIFNKEDLVFSNIDTNSNTDVYYNKHTHIHYIHDFPAGSESNFDYYYNEAHAKYKKRVNRLLKAIYNCRKICLVYIEYEEFAKKIKKSPMILLNLI